MKQALIDKVVKESYARTNRFEYRLIGNQILAREIGKIGPWILKKIVK